MSPARYSKLLEWAWLVLDSPSRAFYSWSDLKALRVGRFRGPGDFSKSVFPSLYRIVLASFDGQVKTVCPRDEKGRDSLIESLEGISGGAIQSLVGRTLAIRARYGSDGSFSFASVLFRDDFEPFEATGIPEECEAPWALVITGLSQSGPVLIIAA